MRFLVCGAVLLLGAKHSWNLFEGDCSCIKDENRLWGDRILCR